MKYELLLILLVFLAIPSVQGAYYDFYGYTSASYVENYDPGISLNWSDNCQIQMETTASFGSVASFDTSLGYYEPDGDLFASSTIYDYYNNTCATYGKTALSSVNYNDSSEVFESSVVWTQTASTGFATTYTRYVCNLGSPYYANIYISSGYPGLFQAVDGRGYCLWRRRISLDASNQRNAWLNQLYAGYNRCGTQYLSNWVGDESCTYDHAGTTGLNAEYYYPFNSSSGEIAYEFGQSMISTGGNPSDYAELTISLVNIDDNSATIILNDSTNGANPTFSGAEGSLSLDKDRQYIWVLHFFARRGVNMVISNVQLPSLNMSILSYQGNWACSEWSECLNSSQSRYCQDLDGVLADYLETRSCYSFPEVFIRLGFEEFNWTDVWNCRYYGACQMGAFPRSPSRKYPINWTVQVTNVTDNTTNYTARIDDVIDISDHDSAHGSYSLKMWYIPPKDHLPNPVSDNYTNTQVICDYNITEGRSPLVYQEVSNDTWLYQDVTAYSRYMSLFFQVRKCDEVELQHSDCFFGLFPSDWYSHNGTNITPEGRLRVSVIDMTDLDWVIDDSFDVDNVDFNRGIKEYQMNNLTFNNTYRIGFMVSPKYGGQDMNSYCVYVDNVLANFRSNALSCSPYCVNDYDQDGINDYTYIRSQNVTETECITEILRTNENCVPEDVREQVINEENFCVGTTLYTYDEELSEYVTLTNSTICAVLQEETDEFLDSPTDAFGEWGFMLGKMFISILIIIAGMIISTRLSKKEMIGIITGIVLFFAFWFAGMIPQIIGLMMILSIALLLAWKFSQKILGG